MNNLLSHPQDIKHWLDRYEIKNYTLIADEQYGFVVDVNIENDRKGNPNSLCKSSPIFWAIFSSPLSSWMNTPATNQALKSVHNRFMYEWSKQEKNPVLITGHTHQPVFASLTHLERLYKQLFNAREKADEATVQKLNKEIRFRQEEYDYVSSNYSKMKPFYFNTGCCCYSDGDITGIEIADGMIRLIKWKNKDNNSIREVLEEMKLSDLLI